MKPMLAKDYEGQDPSGWIASEKLNGMRAIWTGTTLLSKESNILAPPVWFLASLPVGIPLDGELYMGPNQLNKTVAIARSGSYSDASRWEQIQFMLFDAPGPKPASERIQWLENQDFGKYATPVDQWVCKCKEHLRETLLNIEQGGGEGIMLRAPDAPYVYGKTNRLLRVTKWTFL